jgi:hypothetical protein
MLTSEMSITGGPSGMLADLVPGRIRLDDPLSGAPSAPSDPSVADLLGNGEFGPSWSSAMGGGLGKRGEACGDMLVAAIFVSVAMGSSGYCVGNEEQIYRRFQIKTPRICT